MFVQIDGSFNINFIVTEVNESDPFVKRERAVFVVFNAYGSIVQEKICRAVCLMRLPLRSETSQTDMFAGKCDGTAERSGAIFFLIR